MEEQGDPPKANPVEVEGRFDWSNLPADLLIRVLGSLDVADLVSSGHVCRSWNLAYVTVRRCGLCSKKQSPCLLSFSSGSDKSSSAAATLRNLSTNKAYRIASPGPPLSTRYVFGASHGWLVAADDRSVVHLENVVTRHRVALPPVTTLAHVRSFYSRDKVFIGYAVFGITPLSPQIKRGVPPHFTVEDTRRGLYLRAALSSDPRDQDCVVLLMHKPHNQLSFARPGDTRWTWINQDWTCMNYTDFFFDDKDGVFYALRCTGEVQVIDLTGPIPVVKTITPAIRYSLEGCNKYIVRAPWGDLLQIWTRYGSNNSAELRTHQLTIYKVDVAREDLNEIKDLQGHALFIGFGASFFVVANDFPVLTPNCVYLAHDIAKGDSLPRPNIQEVVVFNIQESTFSDFLPIHGPFLNIPPPIWIMPSCSDKGNI